MPRIKLTNTTRTDCAPFSDLYIPAKSHIFMTKEELEAREEAVKNNPGIRHYFDSGKVTIEEVPTEEEEALSKLKAAEEEAAKAKAEEEAAKAKAEEEAAAKAKAEEEAAAKAKAEADAKAAKK